MRSPTQDTPGATRIVAGFVSADAATVYFRTPDSFTASKTGTGAYTIRFQTPMRAIYSVDVSIGQATPDFVNSGGLSVTGFTVNTWSVPGAAQDTAFTFTATGRP